MSPAKGKTRINWDFFLRPGPTARAMMMIIAVFVVLTVVGSAFEQRELGPRTPTASISLRMGQWAIAIFQTSSAFGLFVMILIQSFKQTLRGRFHSRALARWICGPGENAEQRAKALNELLDLIAPSYRRDVLALPIEQLSAQLASAVDIAIMDQRENLLIALAGESARPHIAQLLDWKTQPEIGADTRPEKPELLKIRNTILHVIQRRIDGFQIHVGNEWKSILRIIAIALSGGLAGLGVLVSAKWTDQPFTAAAFTMIVGLLGGLLASVARDLVAIVERYRR